MDAGRGKADHHVAGRDVGARQQVRPPHGADGEAGKVVIAGRIEPRHFRGLAADQSAAGLAASCRDAFDHLRADRRIELAAGEIVEKEQRFGALHHEIVDRHGDEIDADRVVAAGLDGDFDFGADTVVGGDQDRIDKARGLEIEQAAKAADLGIGPGARGGAHQGLDQFHHAIAGVDIDTGRRVARLIHECHQIGQMIDCRPCGAGPLGASYVGIAGCASARAPVYWSCRTARGKAA